MALQLFSLWLYLVFPYEHLNLRLLYGSVSYVKRGITRLCSRPFFSCWATCACVHFVYFVPMHVYTKSKKKKKRFRFPLYMYIYAIWLIGLVSGPNCEASGKGRLTWSRNRYFYPSLPKDIWRLSMLRPYGRACLLRLTHAHWAPRPIVQRPLVGSATCNTIACTNMGA